MDEDLPPLPPEAADWVAEAIEERHGYLSWLGTRVETVERGRVVLSVPFHEKLTNPTSPPTIHGGVAATLLDTAGGLAQRTAVENPTQTGIATVNLNVNYLRRATGHLTATAEVVRTGSTIGVSEVDVTGTLPENGDGGGGGNGDAGGGGEADGGGEGDGDADLERADLDDLDAEDREEALVATGQASYRLFR